MRILHYSLGFPPARRGGMTAYCLDLIDNQSLSGHDVSLIWPGSLMGKNARCSVVKAKPYSLSSGGICNSFAIRNPLPVPLVDGIADPSWQLIGKDISVFDRFFEKNHFEILHLHTLMGLPRELPQAAHRNGVRVVFTTHDYFALCGKLILYRNGDVCLEDRGCTNCCACNSQGLSAGKMRVLQSPLYGWLKETKIVRQLRRNHNERINEEESPNGPAEKDLGLASQYAMLRSLNVKLLNNLDQILFNSSLTKEIYERYGVDNPKSSILHVSNSGVTDKRAPVHIVANPILKIGFFGGSTNHKGRGLLVDVCDSLWENSIRNFQLHYFGNYVVDRPYAVAHPSFSRSDLARVMQEIDFAVIPSKWYETFGFVTSESMSFGRPVVVSDRVGAKDLVIDGVNGRVFDSTTSNFYEVLCDIVRNPHMVERYSKWICSHDTPYTMEHHALDVEQIYRGLLAPSSKY